MGISIGRAGLTLPMGIVLGVEENGDRISVQGETEDLTQLEAIAVRQQLLGYLDDPDERFFPVTWDEFPHLDGFYTLDDANVGLPPSTTWIGVLGWSVTLVKVKGYAAPLVESTLAGKRRAQASVNLAPNPSAEVNATGMNFLTGGSGGAGSVASVAPAATTNYGTKVFRTTWSTATTSAGSGCYMDVPVRGGTVYSFGIDHLRTIATRMRIRVEWLDGASSTISSVPGTEFVTPSGSTRTLANQPQMKIEGITAPSNAATARLRIESVAGTGFTNWAIAQYLEVDGILVNIGSTLFTPGLYVDSPSAGTAWITLPSTATAISMIDRTTGVRSGPSVGVTVRKFTALDECYVNYYVSPLGYYDAAASVYVGDGESVEYGWTGARHASMSYRRADGVVKYNRATNPRLALDSTGWGFFINTNGGTATASRIASSGTRGWAYRLTWTVASTAIAGGSSSGFGAGSSDQIPVEEGTTIYPSIRIRASIAQLIGIRVVFYNSSNVVVGANLIGSPTVTTPGLFEIRELGPTVVPAGATRALIRASWESGTGSVLWGIGDTLDVSMVSTEELPYWDGDDDNEDLRLVVGRQVENKPNNWLLDNGVVQVRPAFPSTDTNVISFQIREGSTGVWRSFDITESDTFTNLVSPTAMTVLYNAPEQVTVRVTGVARNAIDPLYPSNAPVTIDLTLRRGASFVAVEINSAVSLKFGAIVEEFTSAVYVPWGMYLAANNMWACTPYPGALSGSMNIASDGEVKAWSLGIGFGQIQNFLPDPIDDYLWAGADRAQVVSQ